MKYKTALACFLCLGFAYGSDKLVKADFYTDYNASVMDTIFKKNIFNFDIFTNSLKYSPPIITNNIATENINEIDYNAELLSYKKNSKNYLIFYSVDDKKIPTEILRIPLEKTGEGKIVDKNLLKLFKPNSTIMMNVMSFDIDDRGNIINLQYSKPSEQYYTTKSVNLVVKEGDKEVVNRNINLVNEPKDDKVLVYPYELEQYYRTDRYYSYTNAKVEVDKKEYISSSNLTIPYNSQKIELILNKNKEYWRKVNVQFPKEYSKEEKEYEIKRNSTIGEFIKEHGLSGKFSDTSNYKFVGYYLGNNELSTVLTNQISSDITIKAKFNTKIILDNGETTKEQTLLTDDKFSDIDADFFNKDKYHVENYTIYNAVTHKKIKDISSLNEETVNESVIIKANYKENTNTVSIRQDDYNKRFGKVDNTVKDKDIQWSETKKIGELLGELRKKIKPNTGYEVVFRINKQVVNDSDYINKDVTLEIYFKKIEKEWVNVKFIGKGIDKFLSDGQEVLAGSRIDSMINLPTATGETEREFLGWRANEDYEIIDENSNKQHISKNKLLKTNELGAVVAQRGKNLEFTAVYRNLFKVEFAETEAGSVNLSKGTENVLEVDEFDNIGEATKDNKIIVLPRASYSVSHFIADKNVKINLRNGSKEVFAGQRIEETELYNIVPTSDLKLTPVFKFNLFSSNVKDMIENNRIKTADEFLNLDFESTENIRRILGPLYYLR